VIAQVLKSRSSRANEKVYVATKIPPSSPGDWPPAPYDRAEERYPEKYLRERLERSLRDLQTDAIDIVQLHTWTRAWNRDPSRWRRCGSSRKEGKLRAIGISTPEHDQNSLIDLMRGGWLDRVQVIYNIFEAGAAGGVFPAAKGAQRRRDRARGVRSRAR
jgi:aryl-alcohol dehydrogenase-like predicted oxidoreductase